MYQPIPPNTLTSLLIVPTRQLILHQLAHLQLHHHHLHLLHHRRRCPTAPSPAAPIRAKVGRPRLQQAANKRRNRRLKNLIRTFMHSLGILKYATSTFEHQVSFDRENVERLQELVELNRDAISRLAAVENSHHSASLLHGRLDQAVHLLLSAVNNLTDSSVVSFENFQHDIWLASDQCRTLLHSLVHSDLQEMYASLVELLRSHQAQDRIRSDNWEHLFITSQQELIHLMTSISNSSYAEIAKINSQVARICQSVSDFPRTFSELSLRLERNTSGNEHIARLLSSHADTYAQQVLHTSDMATSQRLLMKLFIKAMTLMHRQAELQSTSHVAVLSSSDDSSSTRSDASLDTTLTRLAKHVVSVDRPPSPEPVAPPAAAARPSVTMHTVSSSSSTHQSSTPSSPSPSSANTPLLICDRPGLHVTPKRSQPAELALAPSRLQPRADVSQASSDSLGSPGVSSIAKSSQPPSP